MNKPYRGSGCNENGQNAAGILSWRRVAAVLPTRGFTLPFALLAAIALCVSLLVLASCRSKSAGGPSLGGEAVADSAVSGVSVTAYLIPDREEIEERFGLCLPDSGIVPIEVTIRNETDHPLVIHTSHGLAAPEPFHGFTLATNGSEYVPIEPLDVLAVLFAGRKWVGYRSPGIFDAVIGVAVPPALFYYGHRELTVGRRYRSIFKHSIYNKTKGGAIRPIIVEPGGEASGALFFYLPPDVNPYRTGEEAAGIDSARAASLGLMVRPCAERSLDTLSGVEGWNDAAAAFPASRTPGESAAAHGRDEILFALPAGGKWRGGGLLVGRADEVLLRGAEAMVEVSGKISSSARIAGTAAAGERAACAINFKATSSVYIVDISGPPALLGEIDLDRKIERIFLTGEACIIATNDNRCRYISLDGMKELRNVKIGRHLRDLILDGDRLLVMEEKELSIYNAAPPDPLVLYEQRPIPEADRRFVGIRDDMLYILHGAEKTARDTLAVYQNGPFFELARMVLPAAVRFADIRGDGLRLQLDGGLLLSVLFHRETREFEAEVICHLPFDAALIAKREEGYTVLGRDGSLAADDIAPPLSGDLVTAVPVPLKPPEVTPRRSRAGR